MLSEKIEKINSVIDAEKLEILSLRKAVKEYKGKIEDKQEELVYSEEALSFIQTIAKSTLQNIELHISNLVTLALNSVDPDFPSFITKVEIKRGKIELYFYFDINGKEAPVLGSSGGGAVDITAFGLRIAFLSLEIEYGSEPKPAFTLLLDEPFRDVSPDLQENVSKMVQMLSKQLGLQIIMVSHAEDINIQADRAYLVSRKNGKSSIKLIES